jgi:hypothetical protein
MDLIGKSESADCPQDWAAIRQSFAAAAVVELFDTERKSVPHGAC